MKNHIIHNLTVIMILYASILPATAQDGDAVLAKIDAVNNAAKDMKALEEMTLITKDGARKKRQIAIYQKGTELRMVRFLDPSEVRGVSFLRLAEDRLYLYLPAFRKVRRIASSVKNEDFMGTDFSFEDMSQSVYAKDYTARILPEKAGQYVLELIPRPGTEVSYGKLVLLADKTNYVYRRIEFYSVTGRLQKILTVDDVQEINGYWVGKRMEMRSMKDEHRTVLELKEVKFDQGLSDDFFSVRNLKRMER